tara:strand:+ start:472 stop:651 length:180 start_codon:yes stop_codon:yes gene_type:complete
MKKANTTPIPFANKSFISKALFGIIKCNNSNIIEEQNKKVKLKIIFLCLMWVIKPRMLK